MFNPADSGHGAEPHSTTSEANPTIREADLRLDLTARDSLRPVATGLAVLYLVFAVSHMRTLPPDAAIPMSLVAASTAMILFGLRVTFGRWQISPRWAHPALAMIAGLALLNSLLHLHFTLEPQQTTNLLLVVIGSGLLFLSKHWLGFIILATLCGWGMLVWRAPSSPSWVHFGFALLSAAVLSTLVHTVRVRTLRRLEGLRVREHIRTTELAIAVEVSEAPTFERAMQIALNRICALTGCAAGHAYVPMDASPDQLISTNIWHFKQEAPFQKLRQVTQGTRLASGSGLAGRVLASQKPLWIADVATDPIFASTGLTENLGVVSAFAIPVRDGPELLAVLEFFSDQARPPEESWLEVLANIGAHVGRVIRRHWAEAALRESEAALRESEEKYRLLVENTETPITLYDGAGKLIFINHVGAQNMGSTPEALVGKSLYELFPQPEAGEFLARMQKIIDSGSGDHYEDSVNLPRGERWFWSNLQAIRDEAGRRVGVQIISQDITELKQAEQQLAHAKQVAEQSTRALERFLANLSHEIRTPMHAVVGMAHLLQNTALNVEQKEFVQALRSASEHLLGIVNDILDFSKIEAGTIAFAQVEFNLREIIHESTQTLKFKAREKGLEILVEWEDGLPAFLIGDPLRLRQILMNLLSNAVKFTAAGRITVRTSLLTSNTSSVSLLFTVADTGIGIRPEHQHRVFDRFAQAEPSGQRRFAGTGLGLTIAKQLVEKQGGTITVESEIGKGSTFRVTLPFEKAQTAVSAPHAFGAGQEQTQPLLGLDILLVEDDKLCQMLAVNLTNKWGAKIEVAENGKIALAKMAQHAYDLVLLDVKMPEMDGYETADFIRHKMAGAMREVPILAMTASASAMTLEKIRAHGINDFITKPFAPEALSVKITSLVQERKR